MVKCEQRARRSGLLFRLELRGNGVVGGGAIPLDVKDVGLAADLAVFHIALPASGGFVDCGCIPFPTSRAVKAGFHDRRIQQREGRLCASVRLW